MVKAPRLLSICAVVLGGYGITGIVHGEKDLHVIEPVVYPYLHRPETYPEYGFRKTPPPTWETFGEKMELRTSHSINMDGELKLMVRPIRVDVPDEREPDVYVNGKVMRIEEESLIAEENYKKGMNFLREWDKEGGMVRLAGYKIFRVPDLDGQNYNRLTHLDGSFTDMADQMYDILGDRYLGMQFGESDASYLNLSPYYIYPTPRGRLESYLPFHEYFADYGENTGNRILVHNNELWHHYTAKEATATIVEGQNFARADGYMRLHNAFMRGAGKQYGVLWAGGFSAETQWGIRQYFSEDCERELRELVERDSKITDYSKLPPMNLAKRRKNWLKARCGPTRGVPLNLARRLFYTLYMNNASHAIWEVSMTHEFVSSREKIAKLTPMGQLYNAVAAFNEKHGTPGVMQTPVAMLLDFGAGWRPPRGRSAELITRRGMQYYIWPTQTYNRGDYLTYNVLDLMFPGFVNSGKFNTLEYALTDTPYGEMCDVLLSDVQLPVLQRYPLVIAAGELTTDLGYLRDKLTSYVAAGGNLVLTGENARSLFPEWGIQGEKEFLPAGARIQWGDGDVMKETYTVGVLEAKNLPKNVRIVASSGDRVLLFELPIGKGNVTVTLTPMGMNDRAIPFKTPASKTTVTDGEEQFHLIEKVGRPFYLAEHFKKCLDAKLNDVRLFSLSNERLAYVTTRKGEGEYWLGVFNDHLDAEPFKIVSFVGEIEAVEELDLGDDWIKQDPGYYPFGFTNHQGGESTGVSIAGGDTRIFRVKVKEEAIINREQLPIARPAKKLIAVESLRGLREKLVMWPSFFNEFAGVKVSGQAVLAASKEMLLKESKWFNRRGVTFLVDARDLSDDAMLEEMFDRVSVLTGVKAIIVREDEGLSLQASSSGIDLITDDRTDDEVYLFDRQHLEPVGHDYHGWFVLNMAYDLWDDLYNDLKIAEGRDGVAVVKGRSFEVIPDKQWKVKAENANRMLSLRGIQDLPKAVNRQQLIASHFGGVNIEAKYIWQTDIQKLIRDKQWADEHGLTLMIDFSTLINGYKDIAFHTEMGVIYQKGLACAESIFKKMEILGLNDAIIITHGMGQQHEAINDGFVAFCDLAKQHNVKLHLRNSGRLPVKQVKRFMARFEDRVDNLKFAPSTIEGRDLSEMLSIEHDPKVILLAWSNDRHRFNMPLPLAMGQGKERVDLSALDTVNAILIFDAIYEDDSELLSDLLLVGND
ncbi:hypothetical protein [Poriferisphaera sp. WC338]|uniref:hypothetical protein n=1 Tax=Poriferisphaera sp. WC338 TaxID=3425129 RepID=UPI003D8168D7